MRQELLILSAADEIIKSPGIPKEAPMIQKAMAKGINIISEIEFAGRYTDAKMVCITGSNGKTTTTSLIYHIFKKAGIDAGLAGNIGNSLALQVAEQPHKVYIIELSSFQLDNMYNFKADIARMRSSLWCFSSHSMLWSSSIFLYLSFIADMSLTNTSNPSFLASTAAPAPLSPAPNITIFFIMESPSWPLPLGEVLGIYVLLFYNCFCFLVSAFLWLQLLAFSLAWP